MVKEGPLYYVLDEAKPRYCGSSANFSKIQNKKGSHFYRI